MDQHKQFARPRTKLMGLISRAKVHRLRTDIYRFCKTIIPT